MPGPTVDPVQVEIVRHGFIAAADEMKLNLARTAYNPIIYEVLDFSCGLFDAQSRMVAQADGLPIFLGALGTAVRCVCRDVGLDAFRPGDIYLFNDPYEQGNHINDVTTVQPVFDAAGELAGFASTRAHWLDIGGKDPGGSIDCDDIVQEGLWLRSIRLYHEGRRDENVWRIIQYNVRNTENMLGDLRAQVAASRTGVQRMSEIFRRHGRGATDAAIATMIDRSERRARASIAAMKDGTYNAHSYIDNDCRGSDPVRVEVTAVVDGDQLNIDLAGSGPQMPGPINCGLPAALASCRIALKALAAPDTPANEGDFAPLTLVAPDDCIFNARYPAPTYLYGKMLTEVVLAAIVGAAPDRTIAGNYDDLAGFMLVGGDAAGGEQWIHQEPEPGGWGASAHGDGESALIFIGDGDARNIPAEIVEARYPLRMERHELRRDSGGPGHHRGGLGIVREYRLLGEPATLLCVMDRTLFPPWGLEGGDNGVPDRVVLTAPDRDEQLVPPQTNHMPIPAGSLVSVRTGGGGGWGDPLTRDAAAVHADAVAGYVSREAAERDYGVVLDAGTLAVDEHATAARRARR
jgi:N-methylhydantoinase B